MSRPSGLRSAERRPRHLSFQSTVGRITSPSTTTQKNGRTDSPTARRPVRRRAAANACVRGRRTSRRRQAIRSPVVLPPILVTPRKLSKRAFAPLRLCVFASLRSFSWVFEGIREARGSHFRDRRGQSGRAPAPAHRGRRRRHGCDRSSAASFRSDAVIRGCGHGA